MLPTIKVLITVSKYTAAIITGTLGVAALITPYVLTGMIPRL
jgi:hypothetical protein